MVFFSEAIRFPPDALEIKFQRASSMREINGFVRKNTILPDETKHNKYGGAQHPYIQHANFVRLAPRGYIHVKTMHPLFLKRHHAKGMRQYRYSARYGVHCKQTDDEDRTKHQGQQVVGLERPIERVRSVRKSCWHIHFGCEETFIGKSQQKALDAKNVGLLWRHKQLESRDGKRLLILLMPKSTYKPLKHFFFKVAVLPLVNWLTWEQRYEKRAHTAANCKTTATVGLCSSPFPSNVKTN